MRPAVRVASLVVLGTALVACDDQRRRAVALASSSAAESRKLSESAWDTVWQTTAALLDSLLPTPWSVVVSGGVVFAFDDAKGTIAGFDASTGHLRFVVGRKGSGPAELALPVAGERSASGGYQVIDLGRRRLVHVDALGRANDRALLAQAGPSPGQLCDLRSRFLVYDPLAPWLRTLDTLGVVRDSIAPPWEDFDTLPLGGRIAWLRAGAGGDRCALLLTTGRGFALLDGDGRWTRHDYVERFEVSGAGDRAAEEQVELTAAADAEFSGDTLIVLFNGRTKYASRLLDRYDGRTGAYLASDVLPFQTSDFAVAGPFVIARVFNDSTPPTLIAVRRRR